MLDLTKHAELLKSLESDLQIYKASIEEVALEILKGEVSAFPMFIASRQHVEMGRMIIDKEELALEWSIYASTLEEFVKRGIITREKLPIFKANYKDPRKFICLFALFQEDAGFIFVPYDEE